MDIDIYDFDKTLVPFDSGSLFCLYCLVHYPWIVVFLPLIAAAAVLYALHIINFTGFKKIIYIFICAIPLQKAVKGFWDKHEKQLYPWFKDRPRAAVVISASPDFLLNEIQKRAGIEYLICTNHNPKNGIIIGENCRDEEKVLRLRKEYSDFTVHDVYSDSYKHDKPIFSIAGGNCYHIEKGQAVKFDFCSRYK